MKANLLNIVKHLIGIHKYEYLIRINDYTHLLKCSICENKFCLNTNTRQILPWDL